MGTTVKNKAIVFIHGGTIRGRHWGRMMSWKILNRDKPREAPASHWPTGVALTAPRTISATFAAIFKLKQKMTFASAGNGIVVSPMSNW